LVQLFLCQLDQLDLSGQFVLVALLHPLVQLFLHQLVQLVL